MRRLVVCADGTWKSDEDTQSDGGGLTNVVKMRKAIAERGSDGVEQIACYDAGVGSSGGRISRLIDGGTGRGLSKNVRDCYAFLVDHYAPGDQLFFFGFSRGAFTVRSLTGLVRKCGILRRDDANSIDEAYDFYRKRGEKYHPAGAAAQSFRARHRSHETSIRFLGVWDTVGSLGIPTPGPLGIFLRNRYGFHDVRLSSSVENAFHALAVDERRKPFAPTLWEVRERDAQKDAHQRIEQRWFAGVHSNIGGGYPDCGLSDLTFKWMAERAQECGLELNPDVVPALQCNCTGQIYDNMTGFYRAFGPFDRPIAQPQRDEGGKALLTFEEVDDSVRERYDKRLNPPYGPDNFFGYWRRNPTKWPPHQPPSARA